MPMPQILATGTTVAANVATFRRDRGLSLAALSQRLAEITDDRRYPTSTLSEIERGRRRVDVDDLMALAAALHEPPSSLLMPRDPSELDEVVTSATRHPIQTWRLWDWLIAQRRRPEVSDSDSAQDAYWKMHRVHGAKKDRNQLRALRRSTDEGVVHEFMEALDARGLVMIRRAAEDIDDGDR